MGEYESAERQLAAIRDILKIIDAILALADQTRKSGENLQLSVAVAGSDALKTQLGNLVDAAATPAQRDLAARSLGELAAKYPSLPEDVTTRLKTAVFEMFPNRPDIKM